MKVKITIEGWDSAFDSHRKILLDLVDTFSQMLLYSDDTDVTKVSVYRVDHPTELAFFNKCDLPDLRFCDEKKKKKKKV